MEGATREGQIEYYRFAGHFLNDHRFASKLEKLIWELHANGLSMRNIVKKLKPKYPVYRDKVNITLMRLVKLMKVKYNIGLTPSEAEDNE